MMDNLAATWTGMRKTSTFNEWERVYQGLKVAVENVQVTSRILNQAATDFDNADRAGKV
jgi:uncharacterized protein YukE